MTAVATERPQFARAEALAIANKFFAFLENHCRRIIIAGSLRRRKDQVKDIEILFVPKTTPVIDPGDLFGVKKDVSAADLAIDKLLTLGVITMRPSKTGVYTWGAENKLAIHRVSGIPVDFFATDEDRFFNALFVRTGPKELNQRVAQLAIARGWNWHAYGDGFTRGKREHFHVKAERDVFTHVGLDYQEPWDR